MENKLFIIKDIKGEVWGLAQSKSQAKKQIRWFLPKSNEYVVDILEVIDGLVFQVGKGIKL